MRLNDRGARWGAIGLLMAAGTVGLAGCSSTPPQPYNQYLASWKGKTEQELVVAFGIPHDSHEMVEGGQMLEYITKDGGQSLCTTRFVINGGGRVEGWWYKGSDCTSPI